MTPIGYGLSRTLRHGDNGLFLTPEGYMNSIVHVLGQSEDEVVKEHRYQQSLYLRRWLPIESVESCEFQSE